MSGLDKEFLLTVTLVIIVAVLLSLNVEKSSVNESGTKNIVFDSATGTLHLGSLTLRQKIAQMIVAYGKEENTEAFQGMLIGGVHPETKSSREEYVRTINNFQRGAVIPFFVTADMEGCWNPFENFRHFPTFQEIKTVEEAYRAGYQEGKLLKELGFSINLAPVVDLNDTIWNCRSFIGTPDEIASRAVSYIKGLQENGILATSKHHPGKTLSIKDPHLTIVYATIDENDMLPFKESIKNGVSSIMVSHIIVNGSADSELKPSVVSQKLIGELRNGFSGLIVTDAIQMSGLKNYYSDSGIDKMYVDLFKADNDLILHFDENPKNLQRMISVVEQAVKKGEIKEGRIDNSVIRILNAKGIKVVR